MQKKRKSKGKQVGNVHKGLIRGKVESFDFGRHVCEQQQGLPAQIKEMFHVYKKLNLTYDYSDSITIKKTDNPTLDNYFFNSQSSSIASGVELQMLKVRCLSREYDALIDLGSSHNFLSQQTYDQLRQFKKDIAAAKVEQVTGDRLQVVLVDATSIESQQKTQSKVILRNGRCMHVWCNIVPSLAQQIVLGMPFLLAMILLIDWQTYAVKFGTESALQAVPVAPTSSRPSLQKVSAKTAVRLAKQQGSITWFALVRGPENVQTGLLASASGSSEPFVAAPPQSQSLA